MSVFRDTGSRTELNLRTAHGDRVTVITLPHSHPVAIVDLDDYDLRQRLDAYVSEYNSKAWGRGDEPMSRDTAVGHLFRLALDSIDNKGSNPALMSPRELESAIENEMKAHPDGSRYADALHDEFERRDGGKP